MKKPAKKRPELLPGPVQLLKAERKKTEALRTKLSGATALLKKLTATIDRGVNKYDRLVRILEDDDKTLAQLKKRHEATEADLVTARQHTQAYGDRRAAEAREKAIEDVAKHLNSLEPKNPTQAVLLSLYADEIRAMKKG